MPLDSRLTLLAGAAASALFACAASADVVISSDPTQNMTCSAGLCSPTDVHAVLNVTDLTNMLASGDVIITNADKKRKRTKYVGNIDIMVPLSWTSSQKLTLEPYYYPISIAAPITVMGQGGLVFYGSWTLAAGASVTFWDLNSYFAVGSSQYVLAADLPTLAIDIATNPKGYFALASDYDASADIFRKAPIPSLQGQLLGLGHTIFNLTIPRGAKGCEGLVSTLGYENYIRDIGLRAVTVKSDSKSTAVGTLIGCSQGFVSNIWADGTVSGASTATVGGIVGITTSYGYLQNARANVAVTGGQAGGAMGENDSNVYEVSATGPVNGNINSGGLIGLNEGYLQDSYAGASVTGNNNTGGLVGSNHGNISNTYSTGSVQGNSGMAGGFVGFNAGTIATSYSTGAVTGEQGYTGGFVGDDPLEQVSFGYWDTDTSGISDPEQGAGFPADDPGITGVTTAQLQSKLPYGFDRQYWRIDSNVNGGLPYLRNNPPPQGGPKHHPSRTPTRQRH